MIEEFKVGDNVLLNIDAKITEIKSVDGYRFQIFKFEISRESACCFIPAEFWGDKEDIIAVEISEADIIKPENEL